MLCARTDGFHIVQDVRQIHACPQRGADTCRAPVEAKTLADDVLFLPAVPGAGYRDGIRANLELLYQVLDG